jgi:hypothetical protein
MGLVVSVRIWRLKMDKRPAFSIFLGLLIGAIVGLGIGAMNGNPIDGIQLGSAAGLLIGWIIAATMKPVS